MASILLARSLSLSTLSGRRVVGSAPPVYASSTRICVWVIQLSVYTVCLQMEVYSVVPGSPAVWQL